MTAPLFVACLWVLAATATAMLPMRYQYAPGLALLIGALPLLGWIGWQHGVWITLVSTLAVLSLFRRPLAYFAGKALKK